MNDLIKKRLRPTAISWFGLFLAAIALADGRPATNLPDPEAPSLSVTERLDRLVARIKIEQAAMKSLEAEFVQRKESALLLKPEESTGKFWYQAPDRVRWEFSAPNQTTVLIKADEMLTWFQDLKKAERVNVGKQADRILQFLSAGNSLETLQKYFTLSVAFPKDPNQPYRLELEPRFARIKKKLKSLTIELDRRGFFPSLLRYVEADGDKTEMRFHAVKLNQAIATERFVVELPKDVDVRVIDLSKGQAKGSP
jgi:outer membrane lipoprotein carrier protein